jgi:hypothetical protein
MADGDRALVAALRAELAAVDPSRACDRVAEVAGLGTAAIRGDRPALGRLMVRLLRDPGSSPGSFAWEGAPDHCRAAWLRLHLEFVVPRAEAPVLAARLSSVGLPAGLRVRRGRGVVTWKSANDIGTFLRWINAGASVLELESRQVARSVRGDLNRLLNAESANLERMAAAAARQLAAIAILDADGRLAGMPETVRNVAAMRHSTPEASLAELAAELGIPRGRVQRALERIESAVIHPDDESQATPSLPGHRSRAERPGHDGPAAPSAGRLGMA